MAISITKAKPKAKSKQEELAPLQEHASAAIEPSDMTMEQLADRYGSLEDQISALETNPLFAQFDEIKEELTKRLQEEYEPLDVITVKGEHWKLDIGAAARNPGKLSDIDTLRKILGEETFLKIAKVTLGDVNKYCTPEQVAKVVDSDQGYNSRRKITAKYHG